MITTDRNKPLGVHVTDDVKEALRVEAGKQDRMRPDERVSMSSLAYEILKDELKDRGYLQAPVPVEDAQPADAQPQQ